MMVRAGGMAAALVAVAFLPLVAQAPKPALRHARLYGVASSEVLDHVNRDDARAALKVWFDVLGEQRGFALDSRVDVLDSQAEIRARLENGTVDVLIMGTAEYVELEKRHLLVPVLAGVRGAGASAQTPYVLLAGRSTSAAKLADLRGKNVLTASRGAQNTALAWLEVLLSREHLDRADQFFGSIKTAAKAQNCILPLFFGTVDACVVDETSMNLARELNPQLNQLRVLARSRPMLDCIVATSALHPYPYHQELVDAMLNLHHDARGRQLLMVFKVDRLIRIEPADFDSARELWREYERLPPPPHRTAATAGSMQGGN